LTDGAGKGNPGPGGWGAILVTSDGHVTELGGRAALTTNNQMELSAVIAALTQMKGHSDRVSIYTDSVYVIEGISKWVWGWRRKAWKTVDGSDVKNRDRWEHLSDLVSTRGRANIDWHWVKGHAGTPGNERVDEIATAFALQKNFVLYDGPLAGYALPILDLPEMGALPTRALGTASGSHSKRAPHSYLSVIDGIPMRHTSWADCERRVKGRSGARFKKATSAADEMVILRTWGVDGQLL
jgi:ribonuclease HI